jgi:hypothetical protein
VPLSPPAPNPVPYLGEGLIHWLEDNFIDPYRFVYNWISGAQDILDIQWRYVVVTFQRNTPAGTVEDMAQIGLNVVNITLGDIDGSWDDDDFNTVNTHLGTWLNSWQANASATHTAKEIRYYIRSFNPDLPIGQPVTTLDPATQKPYDRFQNSGTVERVYPVNKIGSFVTDPSPYQVAMSVTFRTAQRRHWGRVYLPGCSSSDTQQFGRFLNGAITSIADATAKLHKEAGADGFWLMVPTTQVDSRFHVALQTVTEVVVDDVPDVIRRRRPKQASIKYTGVAP